MIARELRWRIVEEAKGVEVNQGDRELVIPISDPSEVRAQLDEVIEEDLAQWGEVR